MLDIDRMHRAVSFRNIATHEYVKLHPAKVHHFAEHEVGDLRALVAAVVERFRLDAG